MVFTKFYISLSFSKNNNLENVTIYFGTWSLRSFMINNWISKPSKLKLTLATLVIPRRTSLQKPAILPARFSVVPTLRLLVYHLSRIFRIFPLTPILDTWSKISSKPRLFARFNALAVSVSPLLQLMFHLLLSTGLVHG